MRPLDRKIEFSDNLGGRFPAYAALCASLEAPASHCGLVRGLTFCAPLTADRCTCGSVGMSCAGSRLSCDSVVASCVRSRLSYGSIGMSCARSRLSFFLRQEKRSGLRDVSFLFREVEIAICRFSCLLRVIGPCLVHFRLARFFMAIPTEGRGTRRRGATESAARLSALLREPIGFAVLSAGSTLGLRVPNLRQRVFDSLDSPHAAAGFVGRKSRLSALLREPIGFAVFSAGSTLGLNVEAALRPPQTAPKSLRLSGLSSRCGGVCWQGFASPSSGYTERPDRLQ